MRDTVRLLTDAQTAEILGIQPGTLRHWRVAGRGPRWCKLAGSAIRYRLCDIENWLEAQVVETPDRGAA